MTEINRKQSKTAIVGAIYRTSSVSADDFTQLYSPKSIVGWFTPW